MEILQGKADIQYPLNWVYKVIGEDVNAITYSVKQVLNNKEHTLKESKQSSSGKYISLHLEVLVFNEDERLFIFEELKSCSSVKFIV